MAEGLEPARSMGGCSGCWLLLAAEPKARLEGANLACRVCHGSSIGRSNTPLPKSFTTTSLPLKRYSIGKRTDWLVPD